MSFWYRSPQNAMRSSTRCSLFTILASMRPTSKKWKEKLLKLIANGPARIASLIFEFKCWGSSTSITLLRSFMLKNDSASQAGRRTFVWAFKCGWWYACGSRKPKWGATERKVQFSFSSSASSLRMSRWRIGCTYNMLCDDLPENRHSNECYSSTHNLLWTLSTINFKYCNNAVKIFTISH